jgi:hypothetical protein
MVGRFFTLKMAMVAREWERRITPFRLGAYRSSSGEEGLDLADQLGPGRLVSQHDMIVALKGNEFGMRDGSGD